MKCRQARQLLPLWVGNDLPDASDAQALRAHVQQCPECAAIHRQLVESREVLQCVSTVVLASESRESRPSLWPQLALILNERPRQRDHFNGWIPAVAIALAATVMVSVSVLQVQREFGQPVPSATAHRNLFQSDSRFTSRSRNGDLPIRGLVGQPAREELPQDF